MKNVIKKFVIIVMFFSIYSCGTIESLRMKDPGYIFHDFNDCSQATDFHNLPYVYSGTKYIIMVYMEPYSCSWRSFEPKLLNSEFDCLGLNRLALFIDFFLSASADTAFLPYTLYKQYTNGDIIDPPYFQLGKQAIDNGEFDKAIEYYENGITVLPKYLDEGSDDLDGWRAHYECYFELGNLYKKKSDNEKATKFYNKHLCSVLKSKGGISEWTEESTAASYKALGEISTQNGQIEKAIEYYLKIKECCPKETTAALKLDIEELKGIRTQGLECRLMMTGPDNKFTGDLLWIRIQNTSALKTCHIKDIYLNWCEKDYSFIYPDDNVKILKPKEIRYAYIPLNFFEDCQEKTYTCRPSKGNTIATYYIMGTTTLPKNCYYEKYKFTLNSRTHNSGRVRLLDGTIIQTLGY